MEAMMAQYTNRPERVEEGWELPKSMPLQESPDPNFAPGATEPTVSAPGAQQSGMEMQPAMVPPDPRLGMNEQGGWTREKITNMFPEMFKLDTSDWLDPAEEAKKREGLPYDATKKYNENKLYPGINGPEIKGMNRPDDRPPLLKMSREEWENHVFKSIGGNPFLMNPYDEVVKMDRHLPEIFQAAFPNKTWSDMSRLSKEEQAHWETERAAHHRRVLDEAVNKKKQMGEAYKWMMGQWAYEQKEAAAELSRQDKIRATREAAAGKSPPHQMLLNKDGVSTLHERQPNGEWLDTGKQDPTVRDVEPAAVKNARKALAALTPPMTETEKFMFGMLPPDKQQETMTARNANLTPEKKKEVEDITKFLSEYDATARADVMAKMQKVRGGPTAAAPGAAPQHSFQYELATFMTKVTANPNHPGISKFRDELKAKFKDVQGSGARVDAGLAKARALVAKPGVDEIGTVGAEDIPAPTKIGTVGAADVTAPTEIGAVTATPDSETSMGSVGRPPSGVREIAKVLSKGNHVVWDAAKSTWKALDKIGVAMLGAPAMFDRGLGEMLQVSKEDFIEASKEALRVMPKTPGTKPQQLGTYSKMQ